MNLDLCEIANLSVLISRRHDELKQFQAHSPSTQAMLDSELASLVRLWEKLNVGTTIETSL